MRGRWTALGAGAAIATIVADQWQSPVVYAAKPLAMGCLIAATLAAPPRPSARYRGLLAAGLLCSLAGDVLLLRPESLFVAGLVAFLAAHLCYLTAFRTDGGETPQVALLIPLGAVAAGVLALTWDGLGGLRIPVVGYMGVIVAMWWTAVGRAKATGTRSATLAAAGATAFVVSDGLLALNRFRTPLPASAVLILGPYYAAQFLLAASVGGEAEAG